jgi:hypothetical protein
MSADRNIDQGDSSRSATAVDFSGLAALSAEDATGSAVPDIACGAGAGARATGAATAGD